MNRKCAAVMLHTPTNNVAACGLYSMLGFTRLRKHLSFYNIPAPSTAATPHSTPTLLPSTRPAPVYLDAYLFYRSTETPIDDRQLETTSSHAASSSIAPAPQSRGSLCLGPPAQCMHQSVQDSAERDRLLHERHVHIYDPALVATQSSLLADVGFSGALIRSTEAAGVVLGMFSSWWRASCFGHSAHTPASPPPVDAQRPEHADMHAGYAVGATGRAVRRPAAVALELPVWDAGRGPLRAADQVRVSLQRILPEDSKAGALEERESSTAASSSDASAGWSPEGHDASRTGVSASVYPTAGNTMTAVGLRAQQHVPAAADLTFFQRLFGRP